jgi:hypothetical protein
MSGRRHPTLHVALASLAVLALAGCNTVGPPSVRRAPFEYNQALVGAENEQLLLNLVRLKYRDTPYFLQPTSLSTQYHVEGSIGAGVDVTTDGEASGSSAAGFTVSETPTVTWTPLQGDQFVTELLSPLSIEVLVLLPQAGWSMERVLRLAVQRVGDVPNAPEASGPTPSYAPVFEEFQDIACALRKLQVEGRLGVEVHGVPKAGGGADGEGGDEELEFRLLLRERGWRELPAAGVCAVDRVSDPEGLLRARGIDLAGDGAVLRSAYLGAGGGLSIETRSLLGAMYYLSHGIESPREHGPEGRRLVTEAGGCGPEALDSPWRELTRNLFRVECSRKRPPRDEAYVEVFYQGTWFYIRHDDLDSKSTFGLLMQLFSLQAGGADGITPTLTLDLGG